MKLNAKTAWKALWLALAGVGAGLLTGCTNPALVKVQPWQRSALADYTMNPARDPLSNAQMDHIYFSREAANGGRAVGGSGCGCN